VSIADPAPQHDVANSGDRGDLRHGACGGRTERIALRFSERMSTADSQHAYSRIHGAGRDDPEHVRVAPNRTKHITCSPVPGGENSHLAT
jgi:hypothetical protein